MPSRRVFAVPAGSDASHGRLWEVLGQVGCVELVDDPADADIVIVLMGGPLPGDAELRPLLSPAADGAFELIGVHAPDGDGTIPPIMEDWATGGFYPLDEDALRAALCEGQEGWLAPTGGLQPEPATRRQCSKRNC